MEKVLTVIVPTYNMEKYLDRCLSSLIVDAGHMEQLEVLVINDGSKDRSSEIAHGYEHRYPHTFRVIDKENGHYGSCVNKGLELAKGKYVKLLDSDDFYITENLQEFLPVLNSNDVDMFLSEEKTISEDGKTCNYYDFHMEKDTVCDVSELAKFIAESIPHQCITWRTDMFRELGYRQTEGIMYTDLEWVFFPFAKIRSFYYFPKAVYSYYRGREDQSVAPVVHGRNMWMENKVIMSDIKFFNSIKDTLPRANREIMEFVLCRNIQRIYSHYIVNFHKYVNKKDLLAFDAQLMEVSPELYSAVGEATERRKFITFKYITEWRKHFSRKTARFLYFDLMKALGGLFWKIKKVK